MVKRQAIETAKFYSWTSAWSAPCAVRLLRALAAEWLVEPSIVVCREDRPLMEDGIEIWSLEFLVAAVWNDGL